MQGNPQPELPLKIHQILNRSGFYRLPLLRLSAILRLLGTEEARQAKLIQGNTIAGLIQFTNTQRQMKPNYFTEGEYPPEERDMQDYLSAIIRSVIAERFPAEMQGEARAAVSDPLSYPFNPFNCMGYPPPRGFGGAAGLFAGREMPPPTMPYGNAYLPYGSYPNPEMYYYRMYGAYPQAAPKLQEPHENHQEEVAPPQPAPEREQQEREESPRRKQKKIEEGEQQVIRTVQKSLKEEERELKEKTAVPLRKKPQKGEQKKKKQVQPPLPTKKSKRLEEKRQRIENICDFKMSERSLQKRKAFLDKIFQYQKERRLEQEERQQEEQNYKYEKKSKKVPDGEAKKKQSPDPIQSAVLTKPKPKRAPKATAKLKEAAKEGQKPHKKREPSLELKYYNSITDFDYRVYPPPNPLPAAALPTPSHLPLPPKKPSATVETQTDLNLLVNDFRIIRTLPRGEGVRGGENMGEMKQELREQMNNLHIEEVNSSSVRIDRPHHNHLIDVSQEIRRQNFHLGLDHDPHLEHPKSHELPSEGNELIQEEMPQESMEQEGEVAIGEPAEAGEAEGPVAEAQDPQNTITDCLCAGTHHADHISCRTCSQSYHPQCLRLPQQSLQPFECPRCRIRTLNPALEIRQVCGQFFLQELWRCQFRTRVDLVRLEYLSNSKRGHERVEELQLRCVRVDCVEQLGEVIWPDEAEVRVNGEKVTEFYQSLGLRRRRDAPLVITQAAFKVTSFDIEECGITELAVALRPPPAHSVAQRRLPPNNHGLFLLGLYHTYKPSIPVLFQRISERLPFCGEEFLKGLVGQGEVMVEREVFRLHDPFTGQLMQVPVRGAACRHGQCFDLRTFLALMSALRYRAWRCPVCGRDARNLVADRWMLELIDRTREADQIPEQVDYLQVGNVVLKMGRAQGGEESEELQRKAKRIKKRSRPTVKREHEEAIRAIESHNYADIEKYLTEELQPKARRVKN